MPPTDLNQALSRVQPNLKEPLATIARVAGVDVWAVGGFVRDLVIGRPPYDLDLAVPSDAHGCAERIALAFGGSPFTLDEERATYRVTLPPDAPLRTVDVAAFRAPGIEADLADRDFTVNAMASRLTPDGFGPLLDPFGGRADAGRRLVRMVSVRGLENDPLRPLRGVRIATELAFDIEDATLTAIRERAASVRNAAAERQREELVRMFLTDSAGRGLRLLDNAGLLDVIFPESAAGRGVDQPGQYHYYDVLDHGIEAVAVTDWLLSEAAPGDRTRVLLRDIFWEAMAPFGLKDYFEGRAGAESRRALTKLATFLHDVSKPETKTVEADGRVRFLGHPERGALVAASVCKRLRFGHRETAFVGRLVAEHLRPPQLSQSGQATERAIFRFFRDLGDAAPACLVLSLADAAAAIGPPLTADRWQRHVAYLRYILERGEAQSRLVAGAAPGEIAAGGGKRHFVSGDTLIRALALQAGPEVGRLLSAIDEAAAAGEVTTEEDAIQLARRIRSETEAGRNDAGAA